MKQLRTVRLSLRAVTPDITRHYLNSRSHEEIMSFFGVDEKGIRDMRAMAEKGLETFRLSLYYFLLIENESQSVIGECGFHTWNTHHNRAELFYSLRKEEFKRRGFMTEAVPVVLSFGFTVLGLHRVQALVASDNVPSVRLLDRFGFKKEGILRQDYLVDGNYEDSDCYSLLASEWSRGAG